MDTKDLTELNFPVNYGGSTPMCTLFDIHMKEEIGITLHFPYVPRAGEIIHVWIDPIGTKSERISRTFKVTQVIHDMRVMRLSGQYNQNFIIHVSPIRMKQEDL